MPPIVAPGKGRPLGATALSCLQGRDNHAYLTALSGGFIKLMLGKGFEDEQSCALLPQKVLFALSLDSGVFSLTSQDSEPSSLDSPSSSTLFLSSEEPGRSTTDLPSPSSSCEHVPPPFSPPSSALQPLLPSLLPLAPKASSNTTRHPGLYSPLATSPEPAPRLIDWLPNLTSAIPPSGGPGDEREHTFPMEGSIQGPERGGDRTSHMSGRQGDVQRVSVEEQSPADARPSLTCPVGPSDSKKVLAVTPNLEADVGNILVELRTMNGHLDLIAKALTKLATSLLPQTQNTPDSQGSK
ncbi:uncharacterized protein [Notamacropus eugenii]|uniref:uncharacterized protein n=1 Tax=Notamacropus eugenii TaxID=9315 RepID=UPI003B67E497